MKKSRILLLVVVSLFSLSIGPLVADTRATTPSFPLDDTAWAVGGNFTVAIKVPNYVELSVKLPKLDTFWNNFGFGEVFAFNGDDNTFQGLLLSLVGMLGTDTEIPMPTWSQNGANFTINIDQFSLALQDALKAALGDIGTVELTAPKPPSFTGKVNSSGPSISGKMAISYAISIELGEMGFPPINGTLSLTMSFNGKPYIPTSNAASARAAFDSASSPVWAKVNSEGASRVFSIIRSAISEIKALAPSKGFNLIKSH